MDLIDLAANLFSNDIPLSKVAPAVNANNVLTLADNYRVSPLNNKSNAFSKVTPVAATSAFLNSTNNYRKTSNNQEERYNRRKKGNMKIIPEENYNEVPSVSSSANCMGSGCSIMGGKRSKRYLKKSKKRSNKRSNKRKHRVY